MQILFTFNIKIPGAIIAFQGGMGKMDETSEVNFLSSFDQLSTFLGFIIPKIFK